MGRRYLFILVATLALGAGAFALARATTSKPAERANAGPRPVPVTATEAKAQDVPIILRGLGTVTAFNSVALTSRVEGNITQIKFREGQYAYYAKARQLFDRLLSCCNDVGLLSEEFDPITGRMLGNFPQAYSHVGLINCALNLSRQAGPAEERAESKEQSIDVAPAPASIGGR